MTNQEAIILCNSWLTDLSDVELSPTEKSALKKVCKLAWECCKVPAKKDKKGYVEIKEIKK